MTIDEAIAKEREMAEGLKEQYECMMECSEIFREQKKVFIEQCKHDAEEHEQLSEWLRELKDYRDKNKMVVRIDIENMDSVKDKIEELSKYAESQYNKAIDDLMEKSEYLLCENLIYQEMEDIAEQLKEQKCGIH